jgi:hypothetical protein
MAQEEAGSKMREAMTQQTNDTEEETRTKIQEANNN